MSARKQLLLGALPLPSEILHLIKEFAWMNVIVLAKLRKSCIVKGISTSTYTSVYCPNPDIHIFWIGNERYQFQSYFCECGNYIASNSIISKCRCKCNFV